MKQLVTLHLQLGRERWMLVLNSLSVIQLPPPPHESPAHIQGVPLLTHRQTRTPRHTQSSVSDVFLNPINLAIMGKSTC